MCDESRRAVGREEITGIILAGGEGRRMGGRDKGLEPLAGRPLVEYALAALEPQVATILISANRNLERYAAYGRPVIEDGGEGHQGPLAGVVAALARVATPYALVVPCDVPRPPAELAERLGRALIEGDGEVAVADDGERRQYAFALLRRELAAPLAACLAEGRRGLGACFGGRRMVTAGFTGRADRFRNLNTDEELRAEERALE